jgi:hypothetical protein
MRAATTLLRLALCCRFKYRTIGASASVTLSSSSPLSLFLSWYSSSSSLLLLLLLSLTSCCSGASSVLVQTVLVSGCMLFVRALLSVFLVFGVVACSFAVLLFLLLSELFSEVPVCYLSVQFQAGAVAAHAGECHPSPPAKCARQLHCSVWRCEAVPCCCLSPVQSVRLRQCCCHRNSFAQPREQSAER